MQTITRKSLPQTVSNNRETYTYAPILSIVASIYRTPEAIIKWELKKEKRKAVRVNVDGNLFYFTTPPAHEAEVKKMELTAD